MGICLDTEQNNEEVESASAGDRSRAVSGWVGRATPPAAAFPMQNNTHVKFEPPAVPVIFVLGGPGSGKVTHCDNLMQEKRGLVHINMTDLLQQYAIGNGTLSARRDDMQDFGTLSSKTVTEVLMLEMKMAPTAKSYLVSGYPRSMRDVAEYSDKIQTISGVVLVSWRQRVLERQIEYGARLGHVVLGLARMELRNFYKSVMPVADYFDQSNMLIAIPNMRFSTVHTILETAETTELSGHREPSGEGTLPQWYFGGRRMAIYVEVNGERNPEEVYKDFRSAVLQILGPLEDQSTVNGVSGVGVGAGGIPGEIVGVERVPSPQDTTVLPIAAPIVVPTSIHASEPLNFRTITTPKPELIRVRGSSTNPIILWVVGGPGSNKAALCQRAVTQRHGWTHFSLGQRLRALAESGGGPASDGALARSTLSAGELAPRELVLKLVRSAVNDAARTGHGIVLDGYPRDLEQMDQFEREHRVEPRMVLLDCSKLQLGRGRRDDSVAAFRRRLELFRELSLPMLKSLDSNHRLVIVDGDTDSVEVQNEFTRVLDEEMEKAEALAQLPAPPTNRPPVPRTDLSSMQQFAHAVSRMGGAMVNGNTNMNGSLPNGNVGNGHIPNGVANGFIGMANNKIKPLTNNIPKVSTISQMTHDDVRRMYAESSGDITMNTHI